MKLQKPSFVHKRIRDPQTNEVYLERWDLNVFGLFSLKLHRIPREDFGRHLHDHPWRFTSVILRGGYREVLWRNGKVSERSHRYGAIVRRTTSDRHKIVKTFGTAWTFVVCGPRVRTWGFWVDDEFVPWHKYMNIGIQELSNGKPYAADGHWTYGTRKCDFGLVTVVMDDEP